ncbi:MAG: 50S ribosomal protein L20 [Bacteroidetes bacterium RIFCSPHIGHO2_02_FULL_44_7]|nr:MAG: 50S ribosomal protein L20 [Bacteroidetes bacterium RIFCSPHIGHO2_02_FULL_44_7]
MTRVKKAVNALKTRRNILRKVKGYRFGRSKKERMAQEAIFHAGSYAFAHRRDKKNDFRKLWNVRINAALSSTPFGTGEGNISYSKFIGSLKKKNIALDRKILADLANNHSETFQKVVAESQKS